MQNAKDTSVITTGLVSQLCLADINMLISICIGLATLAFTIVKLIDYLKERKYIIEEHKRQCEILHTSKKKK